MFERDKFKSLVHYVCSRRQDDPASLGSVKLNKILWLSDFSAYYASGKPVTGARYVKRQFGPVPHQILPVLKELEAEGALTTRDVFFHGKQKKEYVVRRPISGNFLEPDELDIVEKTIDLVCDRHTATSISEASHGDVWKLAKDGEEIPYYTVFARPGDITDDDREWAQMQLESVA
jgi:hypothetical protein